jgi:hypothetical protein
MCNILHKWRKYIILTPESSRDDEQPASAELEPDVADLRQILCFTSHLLRSSINKEVYNSAEVRTHARGNLISSHHFSFT